MRRSLLILVAALALLPLNALAAWPTYHLDNNRGGNDSTALGTPLARLWTSATLDSNIYAEPLYVVANDANLVMVATENNTIYALNAVDGSIVWSLNLGPNVTPTNPPFTCGNINPIGITSTPVIDTATNTLYAVGLESGTPIHYQLWAVNLTSGSLLWEQAIQPTSPNYTFDPVFENQRGALALANGRVYIPFGGRAGDCGTYRGWEVSAPVNGPGSITSFVLPVANNAGGFWTPSGEAVDASGNVWVTSGNTVGCAAGGCSTFDYGNTVFKLSSGLSLVDYFAPSNWQSLNSGDVDLGSLAPALLSNGLVFQLGKQGIAYLLRQASPGGANHFTPLATRRVCSQTQAAAYGGIAYDPVTQRIYAPCHDGIVRIDLTGVGTASPGFAATTPVWHGPSESYAGAPILAGGLVWNIDPPTGRVFALNPSNGSIAFQDTPGTAMTFSTPSAGGGRVFTGAGRRITGYGAFVGGWESQGGTMTSGPDAASWAANRLDVFAAGPNHELMHRYWDGSWHAWESLGGYLKGAPGAVSWGPNRIDVVVRGSDDQLWHKWWDGIRWSDWEPQGGTLAQDPDISSWGSGRLDLFSVAPGGGLMHKWWDGRSWSGWEAGGGQLTSAPGAVSWSFNRVDVFARGIDNQMWHRWWDGRSWNGWEPLGGTLASGPDPASWTSGRLDVFGVGVDQRLWRKWWDGSSWSGWEPWGGQLTSDPGAVSWGPQRLDVFARGIDNAIWHRWVD